MGIFSFFIKTKPNYSVFYPNISEGSPVDSRGIKTSNSIRTISGIMNGIQYLKHFVILESAILDEMIRVIPTGGVYRPTERLTHNTERPKWCVIFMRSMNDIGFAGG